MKRAIDRLILYILGFIFLFSGLMKMMDIVGTSLIIHEYFNLVNLNFNKSFLSFIAYFLSIVEFLSGLFVIIRVRRYIWFYVLASMLSFFTIITLYLLIYNPISDCGCFGEVLKLSNLQTFLKNLFTLIGVVYLLTTNSKESELFKNKRGLKIDFAITLIFLLGFVSIYSVVVKRQPIADFSDFKPGTSLIRTDIENNSNEMETLLIYSKDGKMFEFTIDNLPDSTYTFVDSKTYFTDNFNRDIIHFSIVDSLGTTITDSIFDNNKFVFIVIPDISKINSKELDGVLSLGSDLFNLGINHSIVTGSSYRAVDASSRRASFTPIPIYYSDYKSVITLNRSRVGIVYVYDGVIVDKWSLRSFTSKDLQEISMTNPDVLLTKREIGSNLFIQFLFLGIIIFVIVLKILLKFFDSNYGRKEELLAEKL